MKEIIPIIKDKLNKEVYLINSKIKFIARKINAVYNNLKDYERDLIMSAIICAGKKDENNNMTGGQAIGNGLKMFLQNKGPAFIKFGQLLSYMPMLDSDIRKELSTNHIPAFILLFG